MDFHISEEQQLMKKSMEEIMNETKGNNSTELLKKLAEMGFIGLFYPDKFSGSGSDFTSFIINVETLAKSSAANALMLAIQGIQVAYPLFQWASESIKSNYLIPVNTGEKRGAYAYSEQSVGADQLAISTTINRQGNDYVLNGTKTFVIDADKSDFFIVYAQMDHDLCAYIVDRDQAGVTIGSPYRKMGLDGVNAATVYFKDVHMSQESLIGSSGEGEKIAQAVSELFSIGIAAIAVGLSIKAKDAAIAYGKQRRQFGRPVIQFEALQQKAGMMTVNIEASRLLLYKAATCKDHGESFGEAARIARYHAVTTGINNCREAIQMHGGYGYTLDLGIEVLYRDMQGLMAIESQNRPLILSIAADAIGVS